MPRSACWRSAITCFSPALRGGAVEDVVGGGDRRRADGAAGKDIAVADLRVQDADDRGQLGQCVLLADALSVRWSGSAASAAALPCTWPEICDNDCSAVLAALMIVLTLVMVSPKAEMLASCERAAMAKPSLTPMPA